MTREIKHVVALNYKDVCTYFDKQDNIHLVRDKNNLFVLCQGTSLYITEQAHIIDSFNSIMQEALIRKLSVVHL